jgi:hypothetical protein
MEKLFQRRIKAAAAALCRTIERTNKGADNKGGGKGDIESAGQNRHAGDRPWKLLGVWNVPTGDHLSVKLSDDHYDDPGHSNDYLCLGDVMIHPLWPTVSIRPANVAVNSRVTSDNPDHVGDYADWAAVVSPGEIPFEGAGSRVPIHVYASMDTLYSSISPISFDWRMRLPDVEGLEFWTDAWGGTRLPNAGGYIIDQPLSGEAGQFATQASGSDRHLTLSTCAGRRGQTGT